MNQKERADLFQRVYNRVNELRSKQHGGTLPYDVFRKLLEAEKIDKDDWYQALAWARKSSPNLYELFYAAIGRKPKEKREAPPPEEKPEETEAPLEASITPAEALAGVISWLDTLTGDDRSRVMAAAEAFFA